MRVLVVEDERKLATFIDRGLTEASLTVDVVHDGEQALERARTTAYDVVVLDVMLPGMDGFAVCLAIRGFDPHLPILMLSARGMVEDRVKGLDIGADDYLTKPFEFAELLARIRALLRRRTEALPSVLTLSDVTLDPATRVVTQAGRPVELTNKEFALLEYFLRNVDHVLTRAMIAEHVWDFAWDGLTNVIDVYVAHLRRKIEASDAPRLIHSVRGVGYVIREP